MIDRQHNLAGLLAGVRVIPVLVVDRLTEAAPLARALVAGGLTVLEVTLRTSCALEAVGAMREACKEAVIGVGTVLSPCNLEAACKAGAAFAVSPGVSEALIEAADILPLLPGAATVSESMRLLDAGFSLQKFFPAEPSGGAAYLSSLSSVLPKARFCPTGGVTADSAPRYLRLPNVFAIGGSWMAPKVLVAEGRWDEITRLAAATVLAARERGSRQTT